ncbi:hypothetical protein FHX15_004507 [Rhizobium sp. BK650]|uniref:alginate lyase family protein n=1 Tax=Rhizobium sp. BK650 TaxID=2586990 RepID=UPI00161145BA|nr:alginate lyase family protein [Rhizobium sp. BK650]MBB3659243.1 hypothetical protein [Rhizobium sp. BK650]
MSKSEGFIQPWQGRYLSQKKTLHKLASSYANRFLIVLLPLICIASSASSVSGEELLRFPPKLMKSVEGYAVIPRTPFRCQTVPPMTDMSQFFTFYQEGKTQSAVDPKAMAAYVRRTALLDKAKANLSSLIQQLGSRPSEDATIAECIMRQIYVFSENDALLGNLDDNNLGGRRQAVLVGIWSAIKFSQAFAIASEHFAVSSEQQVSVKRWFSRLSDVFIGEFTPPLNPREEKYKWLDNNANTRYWAGAAVGMLAVHVQDAAKFDWAMMVLHSGLDQIQDDGSLPSELRRGARSLHYQSFAMSALAILVNLADSNKVSLSPNEERRLLNAINFTIEMYRNPEILSKRVGHEQIERPRMGEWLSDLVEHVSPIDSGLTKKMMDVIEDR